MDNPDTEIVQYRPEVRAAFEELNRIWIEKHFEMEDTDRAYLTDPEKHIIDPGGSILFFLEAGEPVGTCALIKRGERVFELAKMAVAPSARGRGYGQQLAEAALATAQAQGASQVYLLTDEKLGAAVALYRKLGFQKTVRDSSQPYQRGNLQMEIDLSVP